MCPTYPSNYLLLNEIQIHPTPRSSDFQIYFPQNVCICLQKKLLALIKYTELRHRADFEHSKKTACWSSYFYHCQLSCTLRKLKPLFHHLQAPTTQHLSPNFFSRSLYLEILDKNHLKSNETKLESASQEERDQ